MRVDKLKKITKEELGTGKWLPIKEVAKRNNKTIPTICNWIDRGDVQARNYYGRVLVLVEDKVNT